MYTLDNPVRAYAWGSHTVLAELTGRPVPSVEPEAEMWLGAHPSASSTISVSSGPVRLADAIAADPADHLGASLKAEYHDRLPFLFKVLAAERPLSIQAHPTPAQARAGYAEEETRGVPVDSPVRTYRDAFAKPELFVAQSECEILCGFRSAADSARLLAALELPALAVHVETLRAGVNAGSAADAIRQVVTTVLTIPESARRDLVDAVVKACDDHAGADEAYGWAASFGAAYPGDAGVVISLLLNLIRLHPDDGVYLGAGVPHAYLRGWGLEPQANSDNTVRGGLTQKHVDVPGLLRTLDFEPRLPSTVRPEPAAFEDLSAAVGEQVWSTPAREFRLSRLVLDHPDALVDIPVGAPQVLLCLAGELRLTSAAGRVTLGSGGSAYAPAAEPTLTVSGSGTLVRVTPGRRTQHGAS